MSAGVNKVIILGRLGRDPEMRGSRNGAGVTTLSIATSSRWLDRTSGTERSHTEWHRVKLFGGLADVASRFLSKGRQVYVEGSLRTDKYTDRNGVERFVTEIVGSRLELLGGTGEPEHEGPSVVDGFLVEGSYDPKDPFKDGIPF